MSEQTPGPWAYSKCLCGHRACDQHTISVQGSVGFSEPDARLIAAAPELLEALEAMLSALEKHVGRQAPEAQPGTPVFKALAAIAKAKGDAA